MVFQKNALPDDTLQIDQQNDFVLSNGSYTFKYLYDSLGCSKAVNKVLQIDHKPVEISPVSTSKDCADKDYALSGDLKGQSPWLLHYNLNNQPHSILIDQASFVWKVSPGNYFLVEIEDSTGCVNPIGSNLSLKEFLPHDPLLSFVNNELIALPEGYTYYWYKNDTLIETTNTNTLATLGQGLYHVVVLDHAVCTFTSNKINVSYNESVQLFPNPANNEILIWINEPFGESWDYTMYDMRGNKLRAGTEQRPSLQLDLNSIESGIYQMMIFFEKDGSKHLLRFIKN
jgi:hypothetical protein